ncbi:MAG: DUF362 domain-containing protein [Candidatus Methanofastidiosia archaeon]
MAKLEEILEQADLSKYITNGDYVAIKTHFGSRGGHRVVRPIFLKKIADAVKKVGGHPFVTDTVRPKGIQYLEIANMQGINPQSVGCPVVLADGLWGRNYVRVPAGDLITEIGIASEIYDADAMIVVNHCKGHIQSGFGGAIKNLGMGGIAARSREGDPERGKVHALARVKIIHYEDKCILCGKCADVCDHGAITVKDAFELNEEKCVKCGRCIEVCEEGGLEMERDEEQFQRALAEAAKAVVSTFDSGKVFYVSFITEVMPHCDCHPHADVPIVNDQGVLAGDDPVAIDKASLDIIENAQTLPDSAAFGVESGKGLLEKVTNRNPYVHVNKAAELGLGDLEYELVTIEKKKKSE